MISVCMATYNGEKYIKEQIDSILSQIEDNDELIISDDGSTDKTIEIIKEIDDHRIRLTYNHTNHGYTANFYNALSLAKGDYIFLSDQDDVWLNNKVDTIIHYLSKYDFVVSDVSVVDERLQVIEQSRNKKYSVTNGFWPNLLRSRYLGCSMAFTKAILNSIFPVPTCTNKYPHDLWISLIAERYFKTYVIQEPLMLYRRHGNNVSDGGAGEKLNVLNVYKKIITRPYYLYYVIRQKGCVKIYEKRKK